MSRLGTAPTYHGRIAFDLVADLHGMRPYVALFVIALASVFSAYFGLQHVIETPRTQLPDLISGPMLLTTFAISIPLFFFRPQRSMSAPAFAMLLAVSVYCGFYFLISAYLDFEFSGRFHLIQLLNARPTAGSAFDMDPVSIACALALALALMMRHRMTSGGLLILMSATILPLFSLIGYSFGIAEFSFQMPPADFAIFMLLFAGFFMTYSNHAWLRVFLANSKQSRYLRLQLLVGFSVPWVVRILLALNGSVIRGDVEVVLVAVSTWFILGTVVINARIHESTDWTRRSMERRMSELASSDPLTGLFNRRGALDSAAKTLESCRARGQKVAVVMADLDDFKQVNDLFGHDFGDRVLMVSARGMRNRARSTDVLARWGGEEFLAILPDTDLDGGIVFAEDMRAALAGFEWVTESGLGAHVTASLGVAEVLDDEFDISDAISRADAALYRAKAMGRNRVEHLALPPETPLDPDGSGSNIVRLKKIDRRSA